MIPQIDPLTGGLIFKNEEEEKRLSYVQSLLQKIKNQDNYNLNEQFCPQPSILPLEERYQLALSVGEECTEAQELKKLLENKKHPVCYDGFEPSGRMHIAQGVLKSINVNKLADAGCIFIFWVADWFALLNNKMGGDLDKIKVVGQYFVEVWKALGMKMQNVKFLWASDEINKKPDDYWLMVMDIARKFPLARIKKCATIMGRKEEDDLAVAQLLYPCMQCTDIFFLKADICQLGVDQRKVNMLAREYCDKIQKKDKPVILSHHMLSGLKEGQEKMSKSDPDSAIFMEDSEQDVKSKIKKSYCPIGIVEGNPILDYVKHIIFGAYNELLIQRKPENGGDKNYQNYVELEKDFVNQSLHPCDLKPAVAQAINNLIEPVRLHFQNDPKAKKILELVKSYQVTK